MKRRIATIALGAIATCSLSGVALAADGTKLIDQARAMAGGLTPGDTPGFPVTISQSGSYRLSGNLTLPNANTTAIEISADNVTLDLNGFTISGPTVCTSLKPVTCTPTGTGVGVLAATAKYVAVRHGMIRGMGSFGVQLGQAGSLGPSGHVVEDLQVASNGEDGIFTGDAIVRGNVVRSNGRRGITVMSGIVSGNRVMGNADGGIYGSGSTSVLDNDVLYNGGAGIAVANPGVVRGNSVGQNPVGLSMPATAGYYGNVLWSNSTNVSGGVNLDQNACDGAICP